MKGAAVKLILVLLLSVFLSSAASAASMGEVVPGTRKQFSFKVPNKEKKMLCKSRNAKRKNKQCQKKSQAEEYKVNP